MFFLSFWLRYWNILFDLVGLNKRLFCKYVSATKSDLKMATPSRSWEQVHPSKTKEVQNVFNRLKRVSFNLKIKLHNEDGDNTDELESKYSTKSLRDKLLSHILNCRV